MSSLSHRVSRFASLSAESGADAAVTIAARTFGLLQPGGTHAPEATRMVEEKVVAAYEGAFGASMAWGAFLFRFGVARRSDGGATFPCAHRCGGGGCGTGAAQSARQRAALEQTGALTRLRCR